MGVLTSKLFTSGDIDVVTRLENCATGSPSEVASHFGLNSGNRTGKHIGRLQLALQQVQSANKDLNIPDFDVNDVYDQKFADAIKVYKKARRLLNHANAIDDIVGIKTIKSLDSEIAGKRDEPLKQKGNAAHIRPLLLPGAFGPTGDQARYVTEVHKSDDTRESWDKFRAGVRTNLVGNPNAGRVDVFLSRIEKEAENAGRVPVLKESFVFGKATIGLVQKQDNNGTRVTFGSRISTDGDDDRPVILFGDNGGSAILAPRTLLVILQPQKEPERPIGTTVHDYSKLKKFMGQLAGKQPEAP